MKSMTDEESERFYSLLNQAELTTDERRELAALRLKVVPLDESKETAIAREERLKLECQQRLGDLVRFIERTAREFGEAFAGALVSGAVDALRKAVTQ